MAQMPNGQIVKREDGVATIGKTLEQMRSQFEMALPKHMTADKLIRVALTSLRKNPALLECHLGSLLGCIMTAAQLGLEIGPHLGHAYLIPYGTECTLVIGYKGLCELVYRSGLVSGIWARIVLVGDAFDWEEGAEPKLLHKPSGGAGAPTHAYAVVKMKDGFTRFEVMTIAEVERVRGRSKSGKSGPWVTDFDEMAKKTALRRICKTLPQSPELARAIHLDEAQDAGLAQALDSAPALPSVIDLPSEEVTPRRQREPGDEDGGDPGPWGMGNEGEAA